MYHLQLEYIQHIYFSEDLEMKLFRLWLYIICTHSSIQNSGWCVQIDLINYQLTIVLNKQCWGKKNNDFIYKTQQCGNVGGVSKHFYKFTYLPLSSQTPITLMLGKCFLLMNAFLCALGCWICTCVQSTHPMIFGNPLFK